MCKDPGRNQFPRIPLGIESTHWLLSPAPAARCLELDFPSSDLFVSWRTLGTFHPLPYTHFFAVELTTPSFSFPLSPFFHVGSRTAKLWEIATTTRLSIGRRLAPPWPRDRTAFATIFNHSLLSFTELRTLDPPSGCKSFRAKQQRAFFPAVVGTGNAMTSHDRVDSLPSFHRHLSFAIGTTLIMAVDQPLGCIIRLQHRQGLFQVAVRIRHRGSSKPL